jgi:hypothetical protein
MPIFVAIAIAGSSLYSGYKGKQAAEAGGSAAQAAAEANAADIRGFGDFNASSILNVGAINAQAIIDVGEVNANYIERSTERNINLYGLQADEDVNRHKRAEKQVAGDIRARASGSGIQVNTGSPLQFLNAQVDEGIRQREYMVLKHTETLYTMAEEGSDKAFVTRFTADKNAEVTMANAEANAAMALANAELAASQQENSGELAYQTGQIAGSSAMIQGITGAISGGLGAYSMAGGNFNFLSNSLKTNTWSGSTGYRTIGAGGTGGATP